MHEYLIKAEDEDFLLPSREELQTLRLVAGEGWDECNGLGDYCMKHGEVEISFSCEEPGLQVSVDGPIAGDEADAMAERFSLQLHQALGRKLYVVPL